jgi:hypothetical protein
VICRLKRAGAVVYEIPAHNFSAVEQRRIHCISCRSRMARVNGSMIQKCHVSCLWWCPLTQLFRVGLTPQPYMVPHSQWFNHRELLFVCVVCLLTSFSCLLCSLLALVSFTIVKFSAVQLKIASMLHLSSVYNWFKYYIPSLLIFGGLCTF